MSAGCHVSQWESRAGLLAKRLRSMTKAVLPSKINLALPHPMCFSAPGAPHGFRQILTLLSNVTARFLVVNPFLMLLIRPFHLKLS